jgi:hypothetical protein
MDPAFLDPTLLQACLLGWGLSLRVDRLNLLGLYLHMIDQEQVLLVDVVNPLLHCQIETTFSDSLIPSIKPQVLKVEMPNASRSILLPSSATFAPNVLRALTIYGLIYALIPMSAHLYARYAVKHLPVNTTGSAMKDFTPGRRNLFAKESSNKAVNGVAVAVLLELMHWVAISVLKQAAFALSLSSMKKLLNGNGCGMSNGCKTCTTCNNLNQSLLTQMASRWMRAGITRSQQRC